MSGSLEFVLVGSSLLALSGSSCSSTMKLVFLYWVQIDGIVSSWLPEGSGSSSIVDRSLPPQNLLSSVSNCDRWPGEDAHFGAFALSMEVLMVVVLLIERVSIMSFGDGDVLLLCFADVLLVCSLMVQLPSFALKLSIPCMSGRLSWVSGRLSSSLFEFVVLYNSDRALCKFLVGFGVGGGEVSYSLDSSAIVFGVLLSWTLRELQFDFCADGGEGEIVLS